jgi:hypothetical protein
MTQSLLHAHRNRDYFLKCVEYFSIFLSIPLIVNFTWWAAASYGFDKGYTIESKLGVDDSILPIDCLRNCDNFVVGFLTYDYLILMGLIICILLLFVLRVFRGSYRKFNLFSLATYLINIILLIYACLKIFEFVKTKELSESIHPRFLQAMESIRFDWICIYLIVALITFESIGLIILLSRLFNKKDLAE